ncbi:MAG TPA: CoA-binding protein, partial [Crenalkalicoccus sp.]|nr:CoA-binding protein [Crenalkalicoccus sp.]
MTDLARALFAPRRIALIGASSDAGRVTARAQRFLAKHGFAGEVLPVHPREATVLGARAWPSVAAIPGEVDLAYILLGTAGVEQAVAEVAAKRIPAACILADGFAEAGSEGRARQERVVALARAAGLRLLGPNSMGIVATHARMACSVNAVLEEAALAPGRLALVSQSGSVMGALLTRGAARGLRFSHLVGTGNEADLTAGEVAALLVDDPQVDAILLFLEAIRAPAHYAELARRAHAAGKPVIAYKLGRSRFGAELASTHTGALAGADAAAEAFFRAHGIARVTVLEALLELPPLMIGRRPPARAHRALGVVTGTGGGGAMAVDALGVAGIETRPPDAAARAALEAEGIAAHGRL